MKHLRIVALAVSLLALLTLAQSASAATPPPQPCSQSGCACKLIDVGYEFVTFRGPPKYCGSITPVGSRDPNAYYRITCPTHTKMQFGPWSGWEWEYDTYVCTLPKHH